MEYQLFKKHSADLAEATLHTEEVAAKLSAENIIDKSTHRKVCNDKDNGSHLLMDAVTRLLYSRRTRPKDDIKKSFQTVLDVFRQFIPLNEVVETIEAEYNGQL